jgi:hypothetical protein
MAHLSKRKTFVFYLDPRDVHLVSNKPKCFSKLDNDRWMTCVFARTEDEAIEIIKRIHNTKYELEFIKSY